MNAALLSIAFLLFVLAYFIGYKKQVSLLAGFNQKRVRDKEKLAKIVGNYNLIMGLIMLAGGIVNPPNIEVLIPLLVIGYVILLAYVNTKMVE